MPYIFASFLMLLSQAAMAFDILGDWKITALSAGNLATTSRMVFESDGRLYIYHSERSGPTSSETNQYRFDGRVLVIVREDGTMSEHKVEQHGLGLRVYVPNGYFDLEHWNRKP